MTRRNGLQRKRKELHRVVSFKRLFKDHAESRAFHVLLNSFGFIDRQTMLMKSGDVASVLIVRGPDAESLEPKKLDGVAAFLTSALRVFGEGYVVNLYWIKRSNPVVENEAYEDAFVAMADRNR